MLVYTNYRDKVLITKLILQEIEGIDFSKIPFQKGRMRLSYNNEVLSPSAGIQ